MSDGTTGSTRDPNASKPWITAVWMIIAAYLLLILVIGYVLYQRTSGDTWEGGRPPSVLLLGLAFAAGTALIFAFLIAFAFVSHRIDKGGDDVRGALSLPHGSVSAVLALIILVVFSVTSIHLFSEIRAGESTGIESRGVTQEALASLPADRLLSVRAEPTVGGQPATYIVSLSTPHENSTDFAAELMTIFSTLLVAIVGFYFGQRATTAGVREGSKPTEEERKQRSDAERMRNRSARPSLSKVRQR